VVRLHSPIGSPDIPPVLSSTAMWSPIPNLKEIGLRELEAENARLKKLLAESMLENEVTREALREKW